VTPIPDQDIRSELDRIRASKGFSSASRLSKLLGYVVDKTLRGETDQLKEYAVGIEVFERDDKYDPRLDSIVRVEAGRLRSRLEEYYAGEGATSPIKISLPKGGYSAQFARREEIPTAVAAAPAPVAVRSRATIPLAIALTVVVAGMIAWLAMLQRGPKVDTRPTVAVLWFETNMIGADDTTGRYLTEAVTTELTRMGTVNVASYTSAMRFAGQRLSSRDLSAQLHSTFLVEASVDDEGGGLLVVARLVNGVTERKLWVSDYRGDYAEVRRIAEQLAFDVSAEIIRRSTSGT
jgi:adenylate cyclase